MADLKDTGIELVQLDVTDHASVQAARDFVQSRTHGSLDLLVNCAGAASMELPPKIARLIFLICSDNARLGS